MFSATVNHSSRWVNNLVTVCVASLVAVLGLLKSPAFVMMLFVAIIGLFIIMKNDMVFFSVMLILLCQVINEQFLPIFSFGGISLHVKDVFLGLGFLKLFWRKLHGEKIIWGGRLGGLICFFYLFVVAEIVIGYLYLDAPLKVLLNSIRPMTYYLMYLFLINFVKNEKDLERVFFIIECLAMVVALGIFLQLLFRDQFTFLSGRVEDLKTFRHISKDVTRISTEGMILINVCFFYEFIKLGLLKSQSKIFSLCILFVTIAVLGVSFYRSTLLINIASLMIIFALLHTEQKVRFLKRGVLIFMIFAVLFAGLGLASRKVLRYQEALVERVSTLTKGKKLIQSKSLSIRGLENKSAIERLKGNWLLGIGMGQPYRTFKIDHDDKRTWIHNGYLAMILNFGVIGLVLFLIPYGLSIMQLYRGFRHKQISLKTKAIFLTGFIFLIGTLVGAIIGPTFVRIHVLVIISLFWGCAILAKEKFSKGEGLNAIG